MKIAGHDWDVTNTENGEQGTGIQVMYTVYWLKSIDGIKLRLKSWGFLVDLSDVCSIL